MSITPPSDLVFDVVRAVDPSQYQASLAKFQSSKTGKSMMTSGPQMGFDNFTTTAQLDHMRPPVSVKTADKPQEAYRKFESLMLQNFINAMFTDDTAAVFGQGAGAGYWKNMMVDAMVDEMSQAGGIGIADMMQNRDVARDSINHSDKTAATRNITATTNILVHKSQLGLIRHFNKTV